MSAAEQRLFGHWDSLKGKIKEHWGQITDDELAEVEGQYDQLVGLIQQKTGEARQQIKNVIDEIAEEYGGAFDRRQRGRPRIRPARQRSSSTKPPSSSASAPAKVTSRPTKSFAAGRPSRSPSRSAPVCWSA